MKFHCPICDGRFSALLPVGADSEIFRRLGIVGGGRRLAACPGCGSWDRERLVFLYLKHGLKIFSRKTRLAVLHIAPEPNIRIKLREYGFHNYICGDLMTKGYNYPADVIRIDLTQTSFPDASFDLIICNHVLEHIDAESLALSELRRLLRVGGQAILQVPIASRLKRTGEDFSVDTPEKRTRAYGQWDHVRLYAQDYPRRLRAHGLSVRVVQLAAKYPQAGLNPKEVLFLASPRTVARAGDAHSK